MRTSLAILLLTSSFAVAQEPKKEAPKGPTPTAAEVKYGDHTGQVLDFWQAQSDSPTRCSVK